MRTRKPRNQEISCRPGSIEQQLDMCETGSLRGEEVLRELKDHPNFAMDLSEEDREGDEMSGDDHSSGLQGGESELSTPGQIHITTGMPGDATRIEEEETRRIELAARPQRVR